MAQIENSSLHNRTTEVYQRLRKLDSRLSRVTVNVCGNTPECAGDDPKPIDEHLHDKVDSINRVLVSMEEEMTRLENAVGSNQPQPAMKAPQAVSF